MLEHSILYGPAGSGKTRWIENEVNKLVDSGVDPKEIYCITFTNRARDNLIDRVNSEVNISTSHSLFWNNLKNDVNLIDEVTYNYMLLSLFKLYNSDMAISKFNKEIEYIRSLIFFHTYDKSLEFRKSFIYSTDLDKLYTDIKLNAKDSRYRLSGLECSQVINGVRALYDVLSDTYMDFTELIMSGSFLVRLKAKHVFIDEFQDTSFSEMISLLNCFDGAMIHLMCDINQSIYEWRGAKAKHNLKYFKHRYSPKEIEMFDVYRYGQEIVDIGNKLLQTDTFKSGIKSDSLVSLLCNDNIDEEYFNICNRALEDSKQGLNLCILGRTNMYLQGFIMKFNEMNIPVSYRSNINKSKYKLFSMFSSFYNLSMSDFDDLLFKSVRNDILISDIVKSKGIYKKPDNRVPFCFIKYGTSYVKRLCYSGESIVIFDVETTGLDFREDRVIQLSAIKLDSNFHTIAEFDMLVNTEREVGDSVNTHHFTNEYLTENGYSSNKVISNFIEFSKGCIMVGHNVNFDKTMLKIECERNGLSWCFDDKDFYDTLSLSRFLYRCKSYKLESLNVQLELGANPNHNALDDVIATGELLKHIIKTIHSSSKTIMDKVELERLNPSNILVLDILKSISGEDGLSLLNNYRNDVCKYLIDREVLEDFDFCVNGLKSIVDYSLSTYINRVVFRDILMLDKSIDSTSSIQVLTVHQSKGLGFDSVYYVENNKKYNYPDSEEEIRIQYVATTRTKRKLTVSYLADGNINTIVSIMKGE